MSPVWHAHRAGVVHELEFAAMSAGIIHIERLKGEGFSTTYQVLMLVDVMSCRHLCAFCAVTTPA